MMVKFVIILLFGTTLILGNPLPANQDELKRKTDNGFTIPKNGHNDKLRESDSKLSEEVRAAKQEVNNFKYQYTIWLDDVDVKIKKLNKAEKSIIAKLWEVTEMHSDDELDDNKKKLAALEKKWNEMKAKIEKKVETEKSKYTENWIKLQKLGDQLVKQGDLIKDSYDEETVTSWRENFKLWQEQKDALVEDVSKYDKELRIFQETLNNIIKKGFKSLIKFDKDGKLELQTNNIEKLVGGALKSLMDAGITLTDSISNTIFTVVGALNSAISEVEKIIKAGRESAHELLNGATDFITGVAKGGIGAAHSVVHGTVDLVGGVISNVLHGLLSIGNGIQPTKQPNNIKPDNNKDNPWDTSGWDFK